MDLARSHERQRQLAREGFDEARLFAPAGAADGAGAAEQMPGAAAAAAVAGPREGVASSSSAGDAGVAPVKTHSKRDGSAPKASPAVDAGVEPGKKPKKHSKRVIDPQDAYYYAWRAREKELYAEQKRAVCGCLDSGGSPRICYLYVCRYLYVCVCVCIYIYI